MERDERAARIVERLRRLYPQATCELNHSSAHELLFATILSAQCTDTRVNTVTADLFKSYRSIDDFANAKPAELEGIIRSCGFYRMKAKAIIEAARALRDRFGGKVPDTMEDLLTLRGVARKTANVVLGDAFGKSLGIVVDTHMLRLAKRMGLTRRSEPVQVEKDLMACVPRPYWIFFSHAMIWHGRRVCGALKPQCGTCTLYDICPRVGVKNK